MLDLSSKISSFKKMVWTDEKRQSEKDLYNSIETSSNHLNEIKKSLDKEYKDYIKKREEFANSRKNEEIANVSQQEKTLYNKFKEDLLDDLIKEIEDKLKDYSKSEEYKEKLKKEAVETFEKLSKEDDSLILAVKEEDQDLFDFKTQTMDEDKIGGFVIKNKDLSYQYDFSLRKKLDQYSYSIGSSFYKKISDKFKKEMEDDNDSKN